MASTSTSSFVLKQSAGGRSGGGGAGSSRSRSKSRSKSKGKTLADLHSALVRKIQCLSTMIDESLEIGDGNPLVPSLCSNAQHASDATVGCLSYETDVTAVNSSAEADHRHERERDRERLRGGEGGGGGPPSSSPFGPETTNFASWLASQEFDASAIVWNGDDSDPQDMSMELEGVSGVNFVSVGGGGGSEAARGGGYQSIESKRASGGGGGGGWRAIPSVLPPAVSDAWDRVASTGWQCWEAASPLSQAGEISKLPDEQRERYVGEAKGQGRQEEAKANDAGRALLRRRVFGPAHEPARRDRKAPPSILKKSSYEGSEAGVSGVGAPPSRASQSPSPASSRGRNGTSSVATSLPGEDLLLDDCGGASMPTGLEAVLGGASSLSCAYSASTDASDDDDDNDVFPFPVPQLRGADDDDDERMAEDADYDSDAPLIRDRGSGASNSSKTRWAKGRGRRRRRMRLMR